MFFFEIANIRKIHSVVLLLEISMQNINQASQCASRIRYLQFVDLLDLYPSVSLLIFYTC